VKRVYLIAALCLMPACARAQVTVNPAALAQLAGIMAPTPPVVAPPARKLVHRIVHRAVVVVKPPAPKALPPAPPVQPVVAKPVPPPVAVTPPPPIPVVVKPVLPKPVVLAFGAGSAALPGGAAAALQPFCAAHGTTLIIDAYAPPDPADPSAAMRLSLSRAFALRDALAACGVPAAQIIPRADGATGNNLETARVFISGADK